VAQTAGVPACRLGVQELTLVADWGMGCGQPEGRAGYDLKDVGFGLSQVLPVLVQCYAGDTRRPTLLKQPERHLHPRAQMALGDLLRSTRSARVTAS
jgi:hypothetical protein